jgi:hypothetical protein
MTDPEGDRLLRQHALQVIGEANRLVHEISLAHQAMRRLVSQAQLHKTCLRELRHEFQALRHELSQLR